MNTLATEQMTQPGQAAKNNSARLVTHKANAQRQDETNKHTHTHTHTHTQCRAEERESLGLCTLYDLILQVASWQPDWREVDLWWPFSK